MKHDRFDNILDKFIEQETTQRNQCIKLLENMKKPAGELLFQINIYSDCKLVD